MNSKSKASRRARGLVRLEVWLSAGIANELSIAAKQCKQPKAVIVTEALNNYLPDPPHVG